MSQCTRAIVRNELVILRRDPSYVIVMMVMPLIVMAFIKSAFRPALAASGLVGANGAEQAVPGVAVLFSFFLMSNTGFSIFREHGWGTWERLRASPAKVGEIMVGKAVVPLLIALTQLAVLIGLGSWVFSLHLRGSWIGLVLISVAQALCLVSLAFALVALCRTMMQLNAISTVGTMVLAGLGGAITPIPFLPSWARAVAPGVPSYWAMRGYRSVIIESSGVGAVMLPVVMMLGFSVVFAGIYVWRFKADESKLSWA